MGAFAADRIQILQPFDPAVSETVCFPIPDNCWLESAELIMDAAISSGSLLFTLLARPGARVWVTAFTFNTANYGTANVLVPVIPTAAGHRFGIPDGGAIQMGFTTGAPVGPTKGSLLLTLARASQDTPLS